MRDLVEKLNRINEAEERSSKLIATDVHVDGHDVENVSNVTLEYEFEFEHRSWGVKDVVFHPMGTVEIEADLVATDREDAKPVSVTIKLDLSKVKVQWNPGSAFYPSQLTVYANKDGTVKEAEIMVDYWTP